MKICIFDCIRHEGVDDTAAYAKSLLSGAEVDIFVMHDGKFPDSLGKYDAFIISGSQANVNEEYGWIHRLESLLSTKKPVLGICFGHQLIVKMFHGKVESLGKREFGYTDISLTEKGKMHPIFTGMPERFRIFSTHEWIVTKLPEGAKLLASNDLGIQAFEKGNFIGMQFHPDVSREIIEYLAEIYSLDPGSMDIHRKHEKAGKRIFSNFIGMLKP